MKRFLSLLIISVILLLPACGNDPVRSDALCAETSRYRMIETDAGYYLVMWESLYYADKANLSNWVLVCNEPECAHMGEICPADVMYFPCVSLSDGKILTMRNSSNVTESFSGDLAVYSINPDGTDLSLEWEIPGTDS